MVAVGTTQSCSSPATGRLATLALGLGPSEGPETEDGMRAVALCPSGGPQSIVEAPTARAATGREETQAVLSVAGGGARSPTVTEGFQPGPRLSQISGPSGCEVSTIAVLSPREGAGPAGVCPPRVLATTTVEGATAALEAP